MKTLLQMIIMIARIALSSLQTRPMDHDEYVHERRSEYTPTPILPGLTQSAAPQEQDTKARKRRRYLTPDERKQIRLMLTNREMYAGQFNGKLTQAALAQHYGVDPSTVSRVMSEAA